METQGAQGNTSPIYNRSNMVEDSAITEGNFGNVTNICYRNKDHSTNAFARCVVILSNDLEHLGFYRPDSGRILVNDLDITKTDPDYIRSLCCAVFQDSTVFPFSVAENVSMSPLSQTSIPRVEECISRAGLEGIAVGAVVVSAATVYRFSNAILGFTNALTSLSITAQRQHGTLEYLEFPKHVYNIESYIKTAVECGAKYIRFGLVITNREPV